jgi:hypothetical protein
MNDADTRDGDAPGSDTILMDQHISTRRIMVAKEIVNLVHSCDVLVMRLVFLHQYDVDRICRRQLDVSSLLESALIQLDGDCDESEADSSAMAAATLINAQYELLFQHVQRDHIAPSAEFCKNPSAPSFEARAYAYAIDNLTASERGEIENGSLVLPHHFCTGIGPSHPEWTHLSARRIMVAYEIMRLVQLGECRAMSLVHLHQYDAEHMCDRQRQISMLLKHAMTQLDNYRDDAYAANSAIAAATMIMNNYDRLFPHIERERIVFYAEFCKNINANGYKTRRKDLLDYLL